MSVLARPLKTARALAPRRRLLRGSWLFRWTSLCFLGRETEPTVDEQAAIYAMRFSRAFAGKKVIIPHVGRGFGQAAQIRQPSRGSESGTRRSWGPNRLAGHGDSRTASSTRSRQPRRRPTRPRGSWHRWIGTPAEAKAFADAVRARDLVPGVIVEIPRRRRCWPTRFSNTSNSSRSVPTTSLSTRWPLIGCPPNSPT